MIRIEIVKIWDKNADIGITDGITVNEIDPKMPAKTPAQKCINKMLIVLSPFGRTDDFCKFEIPY